MVEEKLPSRQTLPRVRVTSHSFADVSHGSIANVTQRTVSSSTSMMSTPSNNIRRVQQRSGFRQRSGNKELRHTDIPAGGNATRKLLNLQQLKKTYLNPKPFVLRKPINMTQYDYSVFTEHHVSEALDEGELPPPIKESQIRAWESAEKISANIIFESTTESTSDNFDIFEDGSRDVDTSVDDENHADDAETSIIRGGSALTPRSSGGMVLSIPGYTKGELQILLMNYCLLKSAKQQVDPVEYEEALANGLRSYRQLESASQERAFMSHHTISGKRKVQVHHKKEFLRKLFGYSNNVNQDFVTNNTSYSAYDNVANVQKAFHEDKEEMLGLLEEDKLFEEVIKETRANLQSGAENHVDASRSPLRPLAHPEINESHLLDLTLSWLTSNYIKESNSDESSLTERSLIEEEGEDDQELVAYTIARLKRCVKENE